MARGVPAACFWRPGTERPRSTFPVPSSPIAPPPPFRQFPSTFAPDLRHSGLKPAPRLRANRAPPPHPARRTRRKEAAMGKRIFWICVAALVIVGGWYDWKQWTGPASRTPTAPCAASRTATRRSKRRDFARENSGDTPDGNSEHKDRNRPAGGLPPSHPPASRPAPARSPATTPASPAPQPNQAYNDQAEPVVVPAGAAQCRRQLLRPATLPEQLGHREPHVVHDEQRAGKQR